MTFIVERLVELRRHLDHLEELRGRVGGPADLRADLSSPPTAQAKTIESEA